MAAATMKDIKDGGGTCERVATNFWECTDKDGKKWWCDDSGQCMPKPTHVSPGERVRVHLDLIVMRDTETGDIVVAAPVGTHIGSSPRHAAAMAKRSWWIDKNHVLHCYSSARADCRVTSLVDLPEVSGFYDPAVGRATRQINRIFQALAENRPIGRELSVIIVEGAPLLAWTQPTSAGPDEDGAVGPGDDPATIRKALRLKGAGGHKRSWVMLDHKVWCYANPAGDCVVNRFWESLEAEPDSFHDPDLARATAEVNGILDELRKTDSRGRGLSFLLVENALLLVWTEPGIGPNSDPRVIHQALGLTD